MKMSSVSRIASRFAACLGLLALPTVLHAQRVGVTIARTQTDIVSHDKSGGTSHPDRTSFGAGITYRQPLSKLISLQPELLWINKGINRRSQPTRELGYLELPVLLRISALANPGYRFSPAFSFGPTVAFLARCNIAGLNGASQSACERNVALPSTEDLRVPRFDAGLMAGLGLEGRSRDGTIFGIEGRMERGFVDILPAVPGTSRNIALFVSLHVTPSRWK